jgi:hypothetical protein
VDRVIEGSNQDFPNIHVALEAFSPDHYIWPLLAVVAVVVVVVVVVVIVVVVVVVVVAVEVETPSWINVYVLTTKQLAH